MDAADIAMVPNVETRILSVFSLCSVVHCV